MKKYAFFIATILFLLALCVNVSAEQASQNMQIYNRNELVTLSEELVFKNKKYYISVNDLGRLGIGYSLDEKGNGDFGLKLSSYDAYGTSCILNINARKEILRELFFGVDGEVVIEHIYYACSNTRNSKHDKDLNFDYSNGMNVVDIPVESPDAATIVGGKHYVSLEIIGRVISHTYSVEENKINLWIDDKSGVVLSGRVSLPEGEVAPEGGIAVKIMLRNAGLDTPYNYSTKTATIAEGENSVSYFAEISVYDGKTVYAMFDFDGNYKTKAAEYWVSSKTWLDVVTEPTEKTDFLVEMCMPDGLEASEDVYGLLVFEDCTVYSSEAPLIKKGEIRGTVLLNIDKSFKGQVYVDCLSGDERVFDYGYYENWETRIIPDKADLVYARREEIVFELLRCYRISGTVVSVLEGDDYKTRVFGETSHSEKIYLSDTVDENLNFSIKIPCTLYTYTLSVCNERGAYCGYVNNGESSFEDPFKHFENNKDYSDIKLRYVPYVPEIPVNVWADAYYGEIYLTNLSDCEFEDVKLYCVHTGEDNEMLFMDTVSVNKLASLGEEQEYVFDYPADFYKTDKVSFFVFDSNLKPLAEKTIKAVNEADIPEREMLILTEGETNAGFCEKTTELDNPPIIRDGTMYVSNDVFCYLDLKTDADTENGEMYIYDEYGLKVGFGVGNDELIYSSEDVRVSNVYPGFVENGTVYVSVEDVAAIFGFNVGWYKGKSVIINKVFADVLPDHQYYDATINMYYDGVALGYEDGTFKPQDTVMRNETAAYICRLLGYNCTRYDFSCSDVKRTDWEKSYVGICVNEGIFELKENCFRPLDNITVRETLQAVKNIFYREKENNIVIEDKLLNNIDSENLDRDITRAEIMQMFYNYTNIK